MHFTVPLPEVSLTKTLVYLLICGRSQRTLKFAKNLLNGRTIKFMYLRLAPLFVTTTSNGYDGFYWKLHSEIAKHGNYTLLINDPVLPPGKLVNGTWTGLIGNLYSGKADLISGLGISLQRYNHVGYTTSAYQEPVSFCVMEPSTQIPWNADMKPLSNEVWFCTGLTLGLLCILLGLLGHFDGSLTGLKILVMALGTVLEQPPEMKSQNGLVRFSCLLTLLFGFLIGIVYKSELLGRLTFPEKQVYPKSFEELSDFTGYKLYFQSVGGIENELLKTSANPAIKSLVRRFVESPDPDACMNLAAAGHSACIGWLNVLLVGVARRVADNENFKKLRMSPDQTFTVESAPAMKVRHGLLPSLSKFVGMAKDSGLTGKMMRDYYQAEIHKSIMNRNQNYVRKRNEDSREKPLETANFVAINAAYAFGCFLASLGFLGELLQATKFNHNSVKNSK